MPQIEHDPSPTAQRATLKFDPVFRWALAGKAPLFRPQKHRRAVPLHFLGTFWSPKAISAYRCWRNSFNTASHKRSGLSSPVFASSIMLLAILSLIRLPWSPTCVSHCECDAHDPPGLGIEFGAVEKLRDGHDTRRCRQWYYAIPECDFSRPTLVAYFRRRFRNVPIGLGEMIAGTSRPRTPRLPWQTIHARSDTSRSKRARKRPGWRRSFCDR